MKLPKFLLLICLSVLIVGGFVLVEVAQLGGFKLVKETIFPPGVSDPITRAVDIYTPKTVPQESNGVFRGRYHGIDGFKLTADVGGIKQEFQLNQNTKYSCQARYIRGADGRRQDVLEMYLDFSKYQGEPSGKSDISKFLNAVSKGDPLLIYQRSGISEMVALITDNCQL